jgi:hypothetical protein
VLAAFVYPTDPLLSTTTRPRLARDFKGGQRHQRLGLKDVLCRSLTETTHGVGFSTASLAKPAVISHGISYGIIYVKVEMILNATRRTDDSMTFH